ncbi:RNA polymerase sigma factor [Paenibacillus sp. N1-5-1-14]|uniref:RNA polymerase sigma factor n=1 Tax=Paenibacillus radicibacter TaxID=2972488 RepID=UPI002158EB0E|nr:RNA polymerase sigma factor [Paenibacillus radicibacter]MCR8646014.1 RNA polymerase sigma factor [Paenibacillus radicibacter]
MYTQELFQLSNSSAKNSETVVMMKDDQLVENARYGNREAFGELVRRHRERALGWASSITHDGQLAEDIVQEALISAFLRIETLIEPGKFKYWLQRIVKNQAMMKLRRGGPNGKESSFSVLESLHTKSLHQGEGSDLDRLLFRMTAKLNEERHTNQDPQVLWMRKELYVDLFQLLQCLTPKERAIFEAHVFRQLAPGEIAEALGVSLGSVYTSISRSRTKVQRERIRVYFQGYAQEKKETGGCTRRILVPPIPM